MGTTWSQIWPPPPTLTEHNLPRQEGKVFLITGGNSGLGFELIKILYHTGAKIYMATRSEVRAREAIALLHKMYPSESYPAVGQIEYLHLDLADLTTIKASAEEFKRRERKLDVLWNNAAVGSLPGCISPQGIILPLATNCVGPFLFTKLLLPELKAAAQNPATAQDSVRVIWTSSIYVDTQAPQGGLDISQLETFGWADDQFKIYTFTKLGNWLLAVDMAEQVSRDGIVSLTQNPGNFPTRIWRDTTLWQKISVWIFLSAPKMGAYTMLWAGLSPEITMQHTGSYVLPWGRWHPAPRQDIVLAMKSKEEGGKDLAREFSRWCEAKVEPYL